MNTILIGTQSSDLELFVTRSVEMEHWPYNADLDISVYKEICLCVKSDLQLAPSKT